MARDKIRKDMLVNWDVGLPAVSEIDWGRRRARRSGGDRTNEGGSGERRRDERKNNANDVDNEAAN